MSGKQILSTVGCSIASSTREMPRRFILSAATRRSRATPAIRAVASRASHALKILRSHPIADYRKHGFGRWACVEKTSGRVIGFAGLKHLEDLGEVDLGYRLLPA